MAAAADAAPCPCARASDAAARVDTTAPRTPVKRRVGSGSKYGKLSRRFDEASRTAREAYAGCVGTTASPLTDELYLKLTCQAQKRRRRGAARDPRAKNAEAVHSLPTYTCNAGVARGVPRPAHGLLLSCPSSANRRPSFARCVGGGRELQGRRAAPRKQHAERSRGQSGRRLRPASVGAPAPLLRLPASERPPDLNRHSPDIHLR